MTNSSNSEPILPDFDNDFFSPFGDDDSSLNPINPSGVESVSSNVENKVEEKTSEVTANVASFNVETPSIPEEVVSQNVSIPSTMEVPSVPDVPIIAPSIPNVEVPTPVLEVENNVELLKDEVNSFNNIKPEDILATIEEKENLIEEPKKETTVNSSQDNIEMKSIDEIEPIAPLMELSSDTVEDVEPEMSVSSLIGPVGDIDSALVNDPIEAVPDILDGSIPKDPLDNTIMQYEKENKRLKSEYQERSGRLTALLSNNRAVFERVGASSRELNNLSTQLRNLAIEVLQSENQSHMASLSKLDEILTKEEKKQELYSKKLEENRKKMGEIETIMASMKRRIALTKSLDHENQ